MKVAIIHYWLVNMRGGEKVLEALLEMFPDADIYTHVYKPKSISDRISRHRVFTSKINRLPFASKLYQLYMPLMPNALMDFNLQSYNLVISSESGPAKGVVPNPNAFHICYCHSPMRYLWDMYHEYFRKANPVTRFFMKRFIPGLRLWDQMSSNLVDHFIANSSYVAKRIKRYYKREAQVIYPPVDIDKFLPVKREKKDFYLFVGQLTGYKRADLAIEACIASGRKLVVAGAGAKVPKAGKYEKTGLITFMGRMNEDGLKGLYSSARALLFPGIEDFGIVPVEAQAAGCPVIAFREGGALETIRENVTGLFFDEQTPESLINTMEEFEKNENLYEERLNYDAHVRKFSKTAFFERMELVIANKKVYNGL
jgi:glycosyltransferase involved in cell wall biosynthesis